MKYFGEKSVSSAFKTFLSFSWYFVLVGAIICSIAGSIIIFSTSARDFISAEMQKNVQHHSTNMDQKSNFFESKSFEAYKDHQDWEKFKNLPLPIRAIMLPYFWVIVVLLLQIIRQSQSLFSNFKNNLIFAKQNTEIISKISKLNIAFALLTFNISSLMASILLFMLSEIFKNGSTLQEEHDLTV